MTVNWRFVLLAGLAGGVWIFLATFLLGEIAALISPYTILDLAGMRSVDDPVMILFFAYPFVLSFAAAFVFSLVNPALRGNTVRRGLMFGGILILISTIPSTYIILSSMDYPAGFYLANILTGVIGLPVLGILFSRLWGA
jgi:hypothetical protein